MFAGHFGLAAAVKAKSQVPLWALMVATQLLDIVFIPFLLMGGEQMVPIPGLPSYGGNVIHADYTHSLVGALLLAGSAGWLASRRWGANGGFTIAAVVFSHWLLDLLVHRTDLPLLPGNLGHLPLLGFGLWRYPILTGMAEAGLIAIGLIYYVRSFKVSQGGSKLSIRSLSLAGGVMGIVLLAAWLTDVLGVG